MAKLRNPFGKVSRETFWALQDVSFDVEKGDVVGIIGRNGAGKSTLLKVLSRITTPTTGEVRIFGRVGSLLEVGTGFHPELTGRENIFLNGSILGMRRSEIEKQFDAIVDFAEVEKFLDTPVKRYSSGMYVRLAFAVAAHLNPEILIVDEVLAVGDAQFQAKCLGKMQDVSKQEGRTVLFVSHNMAAVKRLCRTGIHLSNGRLVMMDLVGVVTKFYEDSTLVTSSHFEVPIKAPIRPDKFHIVTGNGSAQATLGSPLSIIAEIASLHDYSDICVEYAFYSYGDLVTLLNNNISGQKVKVFAGINQICCTVKKLPIGPGRYRVAFAVHHGPENYKEELIRLDCVAELVVEPGDYYESGVLPQSDWYGRLQLEHEWSTTQTQKP